MAAWLRARGVDFVASAMGTPNGTTTLRADADNVLGSATPFKAIGTEIVPLFVLVASAEVLRLEEKLDDESELDAAAGPGRPTVEWAASVLSATVGAGWRTFATKQLRRIPATEGESELSPALTFPRGVAGIALVPAADPSGTEFGMFSRTRPKVKANESSPLGVPLIMVEAGNVDATAPADCT